MLSGKLARRLLAVGIAVGLLTVLACGSAEEAEPTATPTATPLPALPTVVAQPEATAVPTPTEAMAMDDEPQYGGRIGKPERGITIFDPHNSRAGYGLQLGMVGNLYSQLVRVPLDTRTGVEGDLAESWTVSGDGSEYTFKLREGAVDHDGDPLTAEDIYANMLRYVERINGVSVRRQGCVRNYVVPIYEGDSMAMADNPGAEVIDDNTILIRLVGPRAAFIPCMTGGFVVFHADTYITPIDTEEPENRDLDPAQGELGGEFGPFKFSDFEINNFFSVERNENYFRAGLPYLDGIDIYEIMDETAIVAAYKSGRVDTSCTWVCIGKANIDSIVGELPDTVVPHLVTIGYRSYQINTRREPFGPPGDPDADKLRRAINLAIDRDIVNRLVFDGIGFLSPPYYVGWDWIYTEDRWREFEGFARNEDKGPEIELAKQLMEELGYGPENRLKTSSLSIASGQNLRESEALQSLLDEIYIDVEVIKTADFGARSERLEKNDFDIFPDSVGATFVDPDVYHTNIFFLFEDGSRNRTGHLPDGWKELHDQQTALQSQEERAPILRQMAQLAIADNFMLGTIRPALQQPHRGNWKNYTPPVLDGSNFSYETLWLDQS